MIFSSLFTLAVATRVVAGSVAPSAEAKHQFSELRDSYDFVIAGGGTAGLTVANRLSEAFPDRTVLVVEYGDVQFAPGSFEPPGSPPRVDQWDFRSLPLTALSNGTASVQVGRVVGGSSAHNGQFFDRASRQDFAAWEALSNGYSHSDVKWDWDSILPFYKKSVTFAEPSPEEIAAFGYTFDTAAAYGGSGPIVASFPPFQWSGQKDVWNAWVEAGLSPRRECDAGDKIGICWVTASQYPDSAERSHAGIGHYLDVIESRTNYDLLVKHKVRRVVYSEAVDERADSGPPRVEVVSLADGTTKLISANLEVILSAGALHTPQILQRSGIGGAEFLKQAGIDLVADLPGVGYNFQDHGGFVMGVSIPNQPVPNQGMLSSNASFEAEAEALYAQRPAKGPYTLALTNNAIYVGLPDITSESDIIVGNIHNQIDSGSFTSHLPGGASSTVAEGYKRQLEVLASNYADRNSPALEAPFSGTPSAAAFLLHPLSRGTVLLNISDPEGEPILDYRTATNPIDVELLGSFLPYFRKFYNTTVLQAWGLTETNPGPAVQSKAEVEAWVRKLGTVIASFEHPCCTAAMLPKELGGVVDSQLRVHGLTGLRVVDTSIFPLIPGTHTSATMYAVAERVADLIVAKWTI